MNHMINSWSSFFEFVQYFKALNFLVLLVVRQLADAELDEEAMRVARRLASGAPMPIAAIKQAVRAQYRDSVAAAAELEEAWAQRILPSADAHEGFSAFLEKRKPVFRGE